MTNADAPGEDQSAISDERELRDGVSDGLTPLEPLDLSKVGSVDSLVRQLEKTAFAGRAVGEAADVLEAMIRDEKCLVVCTLSGAMTIAKMGLVLCDMIDRGWVNAVVSTGALMAHGFVEATGRTHFKVDPRWTDTELYARGYDRVYDTLELEQSLDDIEVIVRAVLSEMQPDEVYGSYELHDRLGAWLEEHVPGRGILKSAWKQRVPVYVPAFTDSELGLDVSLFGRRCRREGRRPPRYDAFRDLEALTEQVIGAERVGIFTVGGGVPRNWTQQIAPYLDIMKARLGTDVPVRRFRYGVRLCPEPVHWGGLSGCTYSEGVSWGKFVPQERGGRYAEVYADATLTWPLVAASVAERLDVAPLAPRRPFSWPDPAV